MIKKSVIPTIEDWTTISMPFDKDIFHNNNVTAVSLLISGFNLNYTMTSIRIKNECQVKKKKKWMLYKKKTLIFFFFLNSYHNQQECFITYCYYYYFKNKLNTEINIFFRS